MKLWRHAWAESLICLYTARTSLWSLCIILMLQVIKSILLHALCNKYMYIFVCVCMYMHHIYIYVCVFYIYGYSGCCNISSLLILVWFNHFYDLLFFLSHKRWNSMTHSFLIASVLRTICTIISVLTGQDLHLTYLAAILFKDWTMK